MGTSRYDLVAELLALSMRKHMGMDVTQEVKNVIRKCQNEEDKKIILSLCRAYGFDVSGY